MTSGRSESKATLGPVQMWNTFRAGVQFRPLELDPVARRLREVATIDDLRAKAKRRLPAGVFDYIDGGAGDERTLARNSEGFGRIEFRPRVLRDVSSIDTTTEIFGRHVSMPLILAPTGYSRITHSAGELSVARAAQSAGVPYSLSTMSTRSIEEVAEVAPQGSNWFQVYVWKDRGLVEHLIERAAAAGYDALWLTVDTAVLGNRERDVRRGWTNPPQMGPKTIIDGIVHPAWTWDFIRHEPLTFANVVDWRHDGAHGDVAEATGARAQAMSAHAKANFDPSINWADIEWLRSLWPGPIVVKGVQTVEDARRCVDAGVDGVAVSNHGGRQLDDAPVPIELIEPVAQAVGGEITIICDGGVRRGTDVVKALALGADACSIGRPYLWGAAVGGERGVDWVLNHFHNGITDTMALCGVRSIGEIDRDLVAWRTAPGSTDVDSRNTAASAGVDAALGGA